MAKTGPKVRKSTAATGIAASGSLPTRNGVFCLLLVACGIIPYLNAFQVPFLYDDIGTIVENATIRNLADLRSTLSPPPATTTTGRPFLNLSFAVNYALSGLTVGSYHAFNILVHTCAGLALFGLLQRTLSSNGVAETIRQKATVLSFLAAAVWLVHPLQTESVTYIVQRAESLAGLLLLLTCFLSVRGFERENRIWHAFAVLACAIGMATKEVMATAPALVLLLDRAFFSGSFTQALRRHVLLYAGLAASWTIVIWLASAGRPGSAGFGEGMSSWEYLRTQFGIVLYYLRLCLWPAPLAFDYAWPVATEPLAIWGPAILIFGACFLTTWAVARNYKLGIAGAWFFIILAPTSTVIPIVTEVAAEHRLYLPLAAVVVLAVIGSVRFFDRRGGMPNLVRLWSVVILILGVTAFIRNRDYASAVKIWKDTVEKRPANALAHYNYARSLEEAGRQDEAIDRYVNHTLRLKPDYAEARANAGLALAKMGQHDLAMHHFNEVIKTHPDMAEAYNNMGLTLARQGRTTEALASYRDAVSKKPTYADAHYNIGNVLAGAGNPQEAISAYRRAIELKPGFAQAYFNLGVTLEGQGNSGEAERSYQKAIQAMPRYAKAHLQLGLLQSRTGNNAAARENLQSALNYQPNLAPARHALQQLGIR